MNKFKGFLLLVIGAVLVKFALENWHYPAPPITFFGFALMPLPNALIIYGGLLLGFAVGWTAHVLRARRKRREAAAAEAAQASAQEEPEPH
jgi:TRAP-type C4-dicarboxylate transport system permease small subunit